ncbi:Putative hypothetical protein [Helicobacter mustelae 12198]|uniref:Uncharacterized protein n=1 Tax=Helicobacter mustelae (strain ATCC 43772 / CCUG 25715 / CIP 103759 / LMG 18044 / NCTC 12198 / R85-136P) TaxID=679897 RepID=D3UGW0_HELM1|nr:Putative hypothetical protein [Helicobacter mustelae 12198]SQH71238.1 Uncharacterised protein [Helicobacter mustelae]
MRKVLRCFGFIKSLIFSKIFAHKILYQFQSHNQFKTRTPEKSWVTQETQTKNPYAKSKFPLHPANNQKLSSNKAVFHYNRDFILQFTHANSSKVVAFVINERGGKTKIMKELKW